jgi:hypothetical protein
VRVGCPGRGMRGGGREVSFFCISLLLLEKGNEADLVV